MKKLIIYFTIFILSIALLTGCANTKIKEEISKDFKIVTSFYPMYIIALNLTDGIQGIVLENMTSANTGCIHDYTLTTKDLIKLENADLFITNGLGAENFLDKVVGTYQDLRIVNSSYEIKELIEDNGETNAHIWLDLDNYMKQVENIKIVLVEQDPENENKYNENYNTYIQEIKNVKQEISTKITREEKTKVVSFSETIAYIDKWAKLDTTLIHTNHEGNNLSAEKLNEIIKYVKENNIKTILVDEETNTKNAESLENETNAKIYKIESGLSGNGDKDSYVRTILENLNVVKSMEE